MKRLFLGAALASVSIVFLATAADAVTMRKCPDGTWVADSQPCPKIKGRRPVPFASAPNMVLAQAGKPKPGGAPKPGDSTKDWRDYINGNPKPPIRPKPRS